MHNFKKTSTLIDYAMIKKIGLFGIGHLGKIHAKCIQEIVHTELIGIYDPNYEEAVKVGEELNVPVYHSPEELIAISDIVDVVTTTSAHFDIAKQAMEQKKDVFIEKPVTATLEEAATLLQIQKETGVKVQVGHVERFNPAFKATQEFIRMPLFIESHRLAHFSPRGNDVSVILDLMIHDLDIVLHIVKSPIIDIQASGVAIITDSFDIANVRLHFASGCVANLTASRISLKNMRKLRVFQDNAYIGIDFLDKKSEIVQIQNLSQSVEDPFALILDVGEGKPQKQISIHTPEIHPTNAIKEEIESFVDAIHRNIEPKVTLNNGVDVVKVAVAIIEKMNKSFFQ